MLSGLSWQHILRRHVGGRPGIGSWAARIGFYLGGISQYLGISHLIGPVVSRAGTTDKRKPGTWIHACPVDTMLAAIAAIWASVWVLAFFAYGISRSIAHRSTLSAGQGL
jgi:hypothetical protein